MSSAIDKALLLAWGAKEEWRATRALVLESGEAQGAGRPFAAKKWENFVFSRRDDDE